MDVLTGFVPDGEDGSAAVLAVVHVVYGRKFQIERR